MGGMEVGSGWSAWHDPRVGTYFPWSHGRIGWASGCEPAKKLTPLWSGRSGSVRAVRPGVLAAGRAVLWAWNVGSEQQLTGARAG